MNNEEKYIVALKKSSKAIKELQEENVRLKRKSSIAIVGMACRFPGGANSPELFWENLVNGVDSVIEVPKTRWNPNIYYDKNPEVEGKSYSKFSGLIDDFELFDNTFFEITPKEASDMDPQQRILLEVSWEALENAGMSINEIKGSQTGVYLGIHTNDNMSTEMAKGLVNQMTPFSVTGNVFNVSAGRLSYFYDLHGPSIPMDTACSSTIHGVHTAVSALNNNEIEMALVGGVNILISPEGYIGLSKINALSKGAHCRAFDANADGFIRSEGCGVIVLKRLDDAIESNDNILGVIKGIAVGQDGKSNGLTAPNGIAQEKIIKDAISNAGISADQIDWVETHGTGTPLGDPVEAEALANVHKARKNDLFIGSVKTNLGHLESASGMASIIKVLLSIKNDIIPASLHVNNLNPLIPWEEIPLKVATESVEWTKHNKTRIAGISSFGYNGSISHTIIEEAPERKLMEAPNLTCLNFTISAKNEFSLTETLRKYTSYLQNTQNSFQDICYTSNISRSEFKNRIAITATGNDDLLNKINKVLENSDRAALVTSTGKLINKKQVFMFTGQGSQYIDMAKELYQTHPYFKEQLDKCNSLANDYLEKSIVDILYIEEFHSLIEEPQYAQVIIFAIEYSLAQLLFSYGLKASTLIGHSIGQYVAACIAGVFTLGDAVKMVCLRGKLMQKVEQNGKMVGVLTSKEKVLELMDGIKNISIAAVNAPDNVTVSGDIAGIDELIKKVKKQRVFTEKLNISHPFHSVLMEPHADEFYNQIKDIKFKIPRIPIISDQTGEYVKDEIANPKYWSKHIYSTIEFNKAIETAHKKGYKVFIEIGGMATLTGLAAQCISDSDALFLPVLRKGKSDWVQLNESISKLYIEGIAINWRKYHENYGHQKVILPNYAFKHKKYEVGSYPDNLIQRTLQVTEQNNIAGNKEQESNYNIGNVLQSFKTEEPIDQLSVLNDIKEIISQITGLDSEEIDEKLNLFSLGLDSLMLVQFMRKVEQKYQIEISINEFITKFNTLNKISEYIEENGVIESTQTNHTETTNFSSQALNLDGISGNSDLKQLFSSQLQIIQEQIKILENNDFKTVKPSRKKVEKESAAGTGNNRGIVLEEDKLSPKQKLFVNDFIHKYINRSPKSKEYAQKYRGVMSDWINSANFRPTLKEILFPIVPEKMYGAKFTDIDGNEYIDIGMGRGANFLGHNPEFVTNAVEEQLKKGYGIGSQNYLAGEVAILVNELTGCERVTFSNTGTEAVMAAVRIARTKRNRDTIVKFAGAYHGTSDGVMAEGDEKESYPISPGTPQGMVDDIMVLNYGSPESLNIIKENANDIAAVLVEPVQSRNPSLQPKEFLQKLRKLTEEEGIILIFDEMITGFRIHPGGAQAYFDIHADICTYGKIPGGGLPLSIIAGKSEYIDAIDAGVWQYGDSSIPPSETTVFGGTFCKHPLAMAAAHASLKFMKEKGKSLQEGVTEKMKYFADTINEFFAKEDVPIKIHYFASQFRFISIGKYDLSLQPLEMELFFNLLLFKGVYTWERRICTLSIDHTLDDLNYIIDAIKQTVKEMRAAGFSFHINDIPGQLPDDFCCSLSSHQSRIFASCEIYKAERSYHIIKALILDGELDKQKLQDCFKQLVNSNESLRTGFQIINDNIVQTVYKDVDFLIEDIDAANVVGSDYEELITEFARPFDMQKPPLMRIGLAKLSNNKNLLIFDVHHIVMDGSSLNIMVPLLVGLYNGGNNPPLSEYHSFVTWENNYRLTKKYQDSCNYWTSKFEGELPVINLPLDFNRPKHQSNKGQTLYSEMNSSKVKALKSFAQKNAITDFMLLTGVFNILLHKITGDEDIIIGTPVLVRPDKKFEESLGMFSNNISLRTYPSPNKLISTFLNEIKQDCLESFTHGEFPFDDLVRNLNLNREGNRTPLYSSMIVYEKADDRNLQFNDIKANEYQYQNISSVTDFVFEIIESDGKFQLFVNFDTELFSEKTVKRWIHIYEKIIDQFISFKDNIDKISIGDIQIISEKEKDLICNVFNDTSTDYPKEKSFIDLFEEQVEKFPNKIAVVFEKVKLTYKELNREANKVAHYLLENHKIKPDDLIGVGLARNEKLIIGILGILKSGAGFLPLDTEYPEERIKYMLQDANPKAVLTNTSLANADSPLFKGEEIIQIEKVLEKCDNKENCKINIGAKSLAYVIYTSGSTGNPKGVMLEHEGWVNLFIAQQRTFDLSTDDNILQFASVSFDASCWEISMSLLSGATLVLIPKETIQDIVLFEEYLNQHEVSVLTLPPTFLKQMRKTEYPHFRVLVTAGDSPNVEDIQYFSSICRYFNAYGPTENSVCASIFEYKDEVINKISIGKPIANNSIFILDAKNNIVPIGCIGELCISGSSLARGYLKNPKLTEDKFIKNPFKSGSRLYKTGDFAKWHEDGNIEFIGRIDEQTKIRGFRVELGEIENRLIQHDEIKNCVVIAKENNSSGKDIVAYIEPCDINSNLKVNELKIFLGQFLPAYMIPSYFMVLDKFPLNINGKVDKKLLPLPNRDVLVSDYKAPKNEVEKNLIDVWQEVLGISRVGITDNFFEIGGDSIKAIQISSKMSQKGITVNLQDMFLNPTIKEMAKQCKYEHIDIDQGIVTGNIKLTPIQKWFFENHKTNVNHFNHSILLHKSDGFDFDNVRETIAKLIEHHDVLRVIFKSNGKDEYLQINHGVENENSFDLEYITIEESVKDKIVEYADKMHAAINISKSPLIKCSIFNAKGGDYLLLVIHHALIDGISWRILIDDFTNVYNSIEKNKPVELPDKTHSFQYWAETLYDYAQSNELNKHIQFWEQTENQSIQALKKDFDVISNKLKDRKQIEVSLDKMNTNLLLTETNSTYNTEINDILITALATAIRNWQGIDCIKINMEGHGREKISNDVEISRTVGWFTSLYPVLISVPESDTTKNIKYIKETLRKIPNKGIDYGIWRYLSGKYNVKEAVSAEIAFNYLGQTDIQDQEQINIKLAEINTGSIISSDSECLHSIEINCQINGDKFILSLSYNSLEYTYENINKLVEQYMRSLKEIIVHCSEGEFTELTPSDLGDGDLSFEELDSIQNLFD